MFWDLDGTLIDSEPHWFASEAALAQRFGRSWTLDNALAMVGSPMSVTVRHLIDAGVDLPSEEVEAALMAEMSARIAEKGVQFRPGARELHEALAARGVRQALVTMSYGPYMAAVRPWLPAFEHIQLGDSVTNGKPAPDIYLEAMAALDAVPRESLGIEDSAAGAGALLSAGLTPVSVPAAAAVPQNPRLIVLDTLEGVTPETLEALHTEWRTVD